MGSVRLDLVAILSCIVWARAITVRSITVSVIVSNISTLDLCDFINSYGGRLPILSCMADLCKPSDKNMYPMKSTNQSNFLQGPYQAVPIFKYVQYLNVPFYSMNYILTIITFFFQHGHGFARQHVNSSMSEKRGKILTFQRFSVSSKMTVKFDFLVRTDTQNYQCRNEITRPNKGIRMEKVKGVWKFWSVNDAHADWKIVNVAK